jgi:HPt (histidine-containing phosphotransfer) domain-containing protein
MQGEAQRCRERGMDDYLSKPLRLGELGPMLAKWMPEPVPLDDPGADAPRNDEVERVVASEARQSISPQVVAPDWALWNPATLTELVGDNPAVHKRLLEKFLQNANEQVTSIGAAAAAGNAKEAAGLAHTLKSAARSVGALALGELCQAIETAGNAGDAPACSALVPDMAAAFAVAALAINHHLAP